jgi:hypothetical protein
MVKRFGYIAATAALVVLAASGVSAGTTRAKVPTTLDLVAVACGAPHTRCAFINTGSSKSPVGDVWTFRVPLLNRVGKRVGTHEATCNPVNQSRAVCAVIESLPSGTITEQGIFRPNANASFFAITGGTGAYEGVGGYARFSFDGTTYPDTLHLER